MDAIILEAIKQLVPNGVLGSICVLFLFAIYKLFKKLEEVQAERIKDAKESQEESYKAISLVAELQPLLRDISYWLSNGRRGAK